MSTCQLTDQVADPERIPACCIDVMSLSASGQLAVDIKPLSAFTHKSAYLMQLLSTAIYFVAGNEFDDGA